MPNIQPLRYSTVEVIPSTRSPQRTFSRPVPPMDVVPWHSCMNYYNFGCSDDEDVRDYLSEVSNDERGGRRFAISAQRDR